MQSKTDFDLDYSMSKIRAGLVLQTPISTAHIIPELAIAKRNNRG